MFFRAFLDFNLPTDNRQRKSCSWTEDPPWSDVLLCLIFVSFPFFFFFARERFLEQSYSLSYSKKRPAKVAMMVLVVLVLVVGLALVAAPVLLVAVIERWRHINVGVLNEWLTSTGDGMVRKPFYYSCSHTSHSMEMLKTKQMSEVDSKTHREKESDREKEREREKGGRERERERGRERERERGRERGREREREREINVHQLSLSRPPSQCSSLTCTTILLTNKTAAAYENRSGPQLRLQCRLWQRSELQKLLYIFYII